MKLEVGKKYKTRSGKIAKITNYNKYNIFPYGGEVGGVSGFSRWKTSGGFLHDISSELDIVSEYTEHCSATSHQVGGNHYSSKDIQPIDYIHANNLGFCEGNVIKYVTRHKDKNGKQDIEKAIHYLQIILQQQYS